MSRRPSPLPSAPRASRNEPSRAPERQRINRPLLRFEGLEDRCLLSHFRYSNLSWEPVPAKPNTIDFHFQFASALESSSNGAAAKAGDIVTDNTGGTPFDFGDGATVSPVNFRVLSVNQVEGYYLAEAVQDTGGGTFSEGLVHTYADPGNDTAFSASGARIASLQNDSGGSYRDETLVNVGTGNHSPVSALPPVIQVADNTVAMFQVPAVDPDGNPLTYRLATSLEASGTSNYTQPPGLTISPTGLVTWDIRHPGGTPTSVGDLWTAHVVVEDHDPAGNVKSSIGLDFLLKVVSSVSAPPVFDAIPTAPVSITPGQATTFVVQASDPSAANTVTVAPLNPPPGMTFAPVPAAAGSRANATAIRVTFTPSAQDASRSFVIPFEAASSSGLTSESAVVLSPNAPPPPPPPVVKLTLVSVGVSGTVGTPLVGVPVGTLIATGAAQTPAAFKATIDWGDGSVTPGRVVAAGGSTFRVVGDHTYRKAGTFRTRVTVLDQSTKASASTGLATGAANVVSAPLVAATNQYIIGPIEPASGRSPMRLHLNLNGVEQSLIPLTPGGTLVLNGGTANDVFLVNLGNLSNPAVIAGSPFRLTVNGQGGGDAFRVQSLPNVPNLLVTLDANSTTAAATQAPGNEVLSFPTATPALGHVVAYDDPVNPGALRVDLAAGTTPPSIAFRDFGSIPEITAQSVEIRGDFGADPSSTTIVPRARLVTAPVTPPMTRGRPYADDLTVTGTGRGRFDATINRGSVSTETLSFASPTLSVFGGQLSDVITVTPYLARPWGVGLSVDGGSQNLPSKTQTSPGDQLVIISNSRTPGLIDVNEGGPRTIDNLGYTNLESILVQTPTDRARDSLSVTDSKQGDRLDVHPGAGGGVNDPMVGIHQAVNSGADHVVGVSSTTVNNRLDVNLHNGSHVVNVALTNPPAKAGRTIAITGDGTDHLRFTDAAGAADVTNTRYPRNSGVVQVRYPSTPKGARPVYVISYTDMILDTPIFGPSGTPNGNQVHTRNPAGLPRGPLSGGGSSSSSARVMASRANPIRIPLV